MLTFQNISTFLSVSGSGVNFGKAAINTGTSIVPFTGAVMAEPTKKIHLILQDNSFLELKEEYVLTKIE